MSWAAVVAKGLQRSQGAISIQPLKSSLNPRHWPETEGVEFRVQPKGVPRSRSHESSRRRSKPRHSQQMWDHGSTLARGRSNIHASAIRSVHKVSCRASGCRALGFGAGGTGMIWALHRGDGGGGAPGVGKLALVVVNTEEAAERQAQLHS